MTVAPAEAVLTAADLEFHGRLGISPDLLARAGVRRVTDAAARDLVSSRRVGDLAGIVYPYADPVSGRQVTCRLRRDHPEIEQGKPRNKYLSPYGDHRHLFFPPGAGALLADTAVPVVFVESEKSALAITAAAERTGRKILAIATGGCWGWRGRIGTQVDATGARVPETGALPDLARLTWTGRDVVLLLDANVKTNPSVRAARTHFADELGVHEARVRCGEVPVEGGVNGPDDYAAQYGDAALLALIDRALQTGGRSGKAKSRVPTQGHEVRFDDPEPWPDAVSGAALLDGLATVCRRYLVLPNQADVALALWILHAYTFAAFFTSPMLAITSPVKRCGKTLLLIVLGALVPRRLWLSNVSAAALFRTIEKYQPTVLIDEADTFIHDKEELRGVLNSGHTRTTAVVIRTAGDTHEPRLFKTWCPKVIALIGKLSDTLADRAIEIAMVRRTPTERVERLRQDRIEAECSSLRQQAQRWATDHRHELEHADPHVPPSLHDRAADCWRPLLAIADAAGHDWPRRAREAALELNGVVDDADQPAKLLALADVRTIFDAQEVEVEALHSETLVRKLCAMPLRPWATWGKKGDGLTAHALSQLLRPFQVHTLKLRLNGLVQQGYTRRSLEEAWTRYTPPHEVEQWNNPNNDGPQTTVLQVEQPTGCSTREIEGSPNNDGRCSTVPLAEGGERPAGEEEQEEDAW